ncbi:MAG: O-antigen ligase family protein [Sphingobacteriaceae bacterium]|nr:O-antigen ligase family protein [Sphingobacteriaceae bacterium]
MSKTITKEKKSPTLKESTKKSHEIPILIFAAAFLVIDFLPYFGCLDVIAPQFVYLSVLNFLIGIYIYNNRDLIPDNLISIFRKSTVLKLYLIFILICGISVVFAVNFSVSVISFMQLLVGLITTINLAILFYGRLHLVFKISILFALNVLFLGLMQIKDLFTASSILSGLYQFKGNTGNVNFLAASFNVKIPFILIGLLYFNGFKKWFLSLVLFIGATCIFLSASRGAYLGLIFQLLIFLIYYLKVNSFSKSSLLNLSYLIIPLALSFYTSNSIFNASKASLSAGDSRYASVTDRLAQINQDGSVPITEQQGRLAYWKNALIMISKSPIVGVGVGNWPMESMAYEGKLMNNVEFSGHAHNDLLEIATESGILNGIVFAVILFSLLIINFKRVSSSHDQQTTFIALLCLMLLMPYGADVMFSFPLYRPPMVICISLMLAFTIINTNKTYVPSSFINTKDFTIIVLIISLTTIYFAHSNLKAYQFEKEMKEDFFKPEHEQRMTGNDILKNAPKFPNSVMMSAEPYARYAGILFYKKKDFAMAEKCFLESQKINPHMQVDNWFMHLIAKEKGQIDTAYRLVKASFYKRPRNNAFYLDALNMATLKKDTLEMLKIHNTLNSVKPLPSNWINTSNSLFNAGYSAGNLILFINNGLKAFPSDVTLLERKRFFENSGSANLIGLAESYTSQLKFDKALAIYKKLIINSPNDKTMLMNIGICYFKLQQFPKAINYFMKTLNSPEITSGLTEYYLGISYLNLKDKANGCNYLNLAKAKNYPGIDALLQQYCK